ncbi:MAG: hypothetical protein O9353_02090, partial [Bacteroidia bacterium]|nr:hypothetical protein [Bacteroidia bacterium]
MKKPITYLFSFLLVMFGLTANSQTTFTLDFSTKKLTNFENLDTLNKGDFYQVEIININTGIYKVLINKKDSVIQSAPVTMPDFASLSLEPLSKLIAGMSPVTAAATPVNPFKSRKDALEAIAENQKIADEINNTKRVLENKFQQLKGIKERIDNLNLRASKYILLGAMETKDSSVNSWTVTADKIADTITLLRTALIEFNKEEKSEKQYYELFSEKEADIIKENFADADGKIKASFKSMDEAIEAAQSLVSAEKATEILKSIIQVQNNAAFKYTSLPQQFNGDFNKLSITIESLKADVPTQKW